MAEESVNAGASRPRPAEPLRLVVSRQPAVTTEETLPLGKHAHGGSLPSVGDWGPQGLSLACLPICLCGPIHSWIPAVPGCYHGICVAG